MICEAGEMWEEDVLPNLRHDVSEFMGEGMQLSVQDSVIAMGMSGSGIPGPAGDRGIFMSLRGEDDPALVWSEANDKFALVRTATSPSASMGTIALTSDADLSVKSLYASVDADLQGDLIVRGGNVNLSNQKRQRKSKEHTLDYCRRLRLLTC